MTHPIDALSDKEKETLRLLVRGYDSKSIARHFDLSVHTVNERLRNARQKLAVSSSREAARLLHESEGIDSNGTPEKLGDKDLRDAPNAASAVPNSIPPSGRGWRMPLPMFIGVFAVMSIILSLIALAAASPEAGQAPEAVAVANAQDSEVVTAARQWLALVDTHDWAGSYAATGQSFKELNTLEVWTKVASETQPQFGKAEARTITSVEASGGADSGRTLMSEEFVPAPPMGYQMVKFQTNFTNKPDAVETLTLVQEGGTWNVVGYVIE